MTTTVVQGEQQRTVLVAVVGGSPAVVTEVLWALTQEKGEGIDEVRVITTKKGRDRVLGSLLKPGRGMFRECCREWGIDPAGIKFDESTIEVLKDEDGGEMDDIRNSRDNELAADQICSLIRRWTDDRRTRLHCSVAGGRKTMSVYLTIAMMLYGNSKDRLWHVLVEPAELEWCEDFFYPHREPRELLVKDSSGNVHKRLSSDVARIDLAEIPFVRLRGVRAEDLRSASAPDSAAGYGLIVEETQARLEFLTEAETAPLHILKAERPHWKVRLSVAGSDFDLSAAQGVVYALVAESRARMRGGDGGLSIADINTEELKRVFRQLTGIGYEPTLEETEFKFITDWVRRVENGRPLDREEFKAAVEQAVSKGGTRLRSQGLPERFIIVNANEYKRGQAARYVLQLPPDAIRIAD